MGGREGGREGSSAYHTALFRAGKAAKSSQKSPVLHHKTMGDV